MGWNAEILTSFPFETVIGGLLSAHFLSGRVGFEIEKGWPCEGPLLRLAVDIAERLLPGSFLMLIWAN